ncbi:hypothetical protein D4R42_02525 [bacterium]|nr:MAG: hypothetical protein D4R42_02525 [bacterium]
MAWEHGLEVKGKPKIAVCICHTGEATMEWSHRTYGPLIFNHVPWCEKVPLLCRGVPIAVSRNKLVEDALKAGCSHVFFIDADHVPETPADINEALRQLLLCDADMVTALYRAKKQEGFPYNIWKKVEGSEGYVAVPDGGWTEGTNFFTVDVAGIGNCLIKREVFEKIPKPWFIWDKPSPSEDFAFFEKAAKHGFKLWVFSAVRFSHIGKLAVQTDGKVRTLRV